MTPLAAYANRLSVRPGETIRFHARGERPTLTRADVVRVQCADPNPAIGGVQVSDVRATLSQDIELLPLAVPRGSYGRVDLGTAVADASELTISVRAWRRSPTPRDQALISLGGAPGATGVRLKLAEDGCVEAEITGGGGAVHRLTLSAPQQTGCWYAISLVFAADGGLSLSQTALRYGVSSEATLTAAADAGTLDTRAVLGGLRNATIYFGASSDAVDDAMRFNGRLEAPRLMACAAGADTAANPGSTEGALACIALWDFSEDPTSSRIFDRGPNALHGRLINAPVRGVTGSLWNGREMSWRHAPEQYASIHFHDDDIEDCNWPVAVSWTVPDDLPSGQYALMLSDGAAEENVPFWVVPAKGKPSAKIAVLVSTFTYTVYGNHARPEWSMVPGWQQDWQAQVAAWGAYPHNPGDHQDLGLSTYNTHTDGSGISIASWHRPMLNVRLGYLTYPYPDIRASGLRHYPADSHLTFWLDAKGFEYDIITDFELHHEGADLLAEYQVVMTGSHPEYHTREMLDGLTAYRDGGGRFCYLGGNGFYWKIALNPERDGVVEIRRGEGGIRAWAAEPGEYYNQFDGEYGGLWRRNGRPPQVLSGVGFSAQGNFVGSHYRVLPEGRTSRAAWILDGVSGETFGGHGFSGHGAAGFELDRADKALGTPQHAVVLAASEGHPPEAPWVLVPEERLTHLTTIPGAKDDELIRADMVFFETAGGQGAVFSTGSITYCGSLPTNGCDNDVSRITENVVRRFLDPAPFEMPGS